MDPSHDYPLYLPWLQEDKHTYDRGFSGVPSVRTSCPLNPVLYFSMPVTVGSYSFPYEAHLARAKLESEGIPAFVADEHTINMQWLYSQALGGVKVQVPEDFAEQARELLEEDLAQRPIEQELINCPQCGACEFAYLVRGKRVAYLLFWLLGFPLWRVRRQRECRVCGFVEGLET